MVVLLITPVFYIIFIWYLDCLFGPDLSLLGYNMGVRV